MAHLDVYPMPGRAQRGYVVDVRANLLAGLNPVFNIKGQPHVMLTQALAAVPSRELREVAGSLQDQRETVLRALDLLLTGL
jgi:toxin CcdB